MGSVDFARPGLLLLRAFSGVQFVRSQCRRQVATFAQKGQRYRQSAARLSAARSASGRIRRSVPYAGDRRGRLVHRSQLSTAAVVSLLQRRSESLPVLAVSSRQVAVRAQRWPAISAPRLLHGSWLSSSRTRTGPSTHAGRRVVVVPSLSAANALPSARRHPRRLANVHVSMCAANQRVQRKNIFGRLVLHGVSVAFKRSFTAVLGVAVVPLQSTCLHSFVLMANQVRLLSFFFSSFFFFYSCMIERSLNHRTRFTRRLRRRNRLVSMAEVGRLARKISGQYLGWDGVFVLRLIEHNHGSIMATLIVSRLWEFYANQMKMQEEGNSGPDAEMGSVASVGAQQSGSWHSCHPTACHVSGHHHYGAGGGGPPQPGMPGKRMPQNGFWSK